MRDAPTLSTSPAAGSGGRRPPLGLFLVGALAATVGLAAGALRRHLVTGESMVPALRPGDRLVVVRLPWCWPLRPGQVVVAVDPRDRSRRLVKRVAAVGPGGVQVLGDQPGASTDSRHFGPLARSDVQGRVVYRYGPPGRAGWISGPRSPAGPRYSRP